MAEGTEIGTAYLSILPSAAGFGAKLQAEITGQAAGVGQQAGKALGAGITTSASGIARSIGGLFAAIGTTRFLKGSIDEAQEAVKVGNLTNAVIKSTGSAAGVTAKQVGDLATSLSKVAGIDDEVIQGAENVLLTFRSVQNQVGAGNDIFNQATKAALDMSAALGTDLQGSVIQLGKALNDPIQGLTALRRVGVSFTEEQQAQIKALQESGDLLGAQKVILGELAKEFGGAAAANATALDRLHVSVKNLEESLGTALLPAINTTAGGLTEMLGIFTALPGPIQSVTVALVGLGAASIAIGLLAPKIRAAKLELEGLGAAGATAGGALAFLGKVGAVGAVVGGVALALGALGRQLTNLTKGPSASAADMASALADLGQTGAVTGELAKQFGSNLSGLGRELNQFTTPKIIQSLALLNPNLQDAKRDVKAVDQALADLVTNGRPELAAAAIDRITAAIVAEGRDPTAFTDRLGHYHDALGAVNLQAKLAAGGLDAAGNAAGQAGDLAGASADSWKALGDRIKEFASTQISDWSNKIAGDLTSALDPMSRFGADTAKNVASLRDAVSGAAADLTKAKGDLAKLTAVPADPVEAFLARGKGATADQIDAANSTITAAAKKLAASQAELAEAQRSPFAKLKENLTANLKTVTDWKANLEKLASRGKVGEALAKDLAGLGPAAAGAVAEATRKSDKELGGMETLFAGSGKIIADAASGSLEAHLDEIGSNGELIATITAKKYKDTLPPKMMAATLAAMDAVQKQLMNSTLSVLPFPSLAGGEVSPEEFAQRTRGWGGQTAAAPAAALPPTTTNNIKVEVNSTETPEPSHLAKAIAWAL